MKTISIVTVVYNDCYNIEKTILSVANQTFKDFEYIVVDGNSTDGTQAVVYSHQDKVTTFISEPDCGIYDAMNKAIDLASGEWILFMNSGDTFYGDDTLEELFKNDFDSSIDIVFGDTVYVYKWGKTLEVTPQPLAFKYNLPFTHQSSMVRTRLLKERKFDLSYKILADLESFYYFYKNNYKFLQVDLIISNYDMSGFSFTHPTLLYEENARIFGRNSCGVRHVIMLFLIRVKYSIMGIIPSSVVDSIRKYKKRSKIVG